MLAGSSYLSIPGGIVCRVQAGWPECYGGVQSSSELEGGTLLEGSRQGSGRGAPLYPGPERHCGVDDVNGAEVLTEGAEVPQRLEQGLCLEQVYVVALSPLPHRHGAPRAADEQVVHSQAFKSTFVLRSRLRESSGSSPPGSPEDAKAPERDQC